MKEKYVYTRPVNGYPEWNNNSEIFQLNRMEPHAAFTPYDSIDEALAGERNASRRVLSLNGVWKFAFADNPENRIQEFYERDYDCSTWADIQVPGHWQLQGYDYPHYTNIRYPWMDSEEIKAPYAPTRYNPVGSYVRSFILPDSWEGDPVFISFQGVESAFYVWVNGDLVGYSEDSFTPAEFDITPYLIKGENKLAVEVYRWCDGSWLEDQDFWRMSGIFRDVFLYARSNTHIYDFHVQTELDAAYCHAELKLDVKLNTYFKTPVNSLSIEAQLYDSKHAPIDHDPMATHLEITDAGYQTLRFLTPVANPLKWSAEEPNLYILVLRLMDEHGRLTEAVSCRVGFRKFELKNGLMQINGKRIVFKGINRHEFSCHTGRAISRADMAQDVRLMKAHNINAVRTSHYPNHPIWYDFCNEYGLYVIDETNLETHGTWSYGQTELGDTLPGSKPEWTQNLLDRCASMFERDKNHPSILIWSLGNESFGGDNFLEMYRFFKQADATRLVHYEGVFHWRASEGASDMESQMYTKPDDVEAYALSNPSKPFILCEYSHAMGNSCGGLHKYWELFERYPMLQGGFIWDWIDQAIATASESGIPYFAYGGDFGEKPNDGNFCGNGLIFADRKVSPKIYEVKKCYESIRFSIVDWQELLINVNNDQLFLSLDPYDFVWEVACDGIVIQQGALEVHAQPGSSARVKVPYEKPNKKGLGAEYVLTVSCKLKESTSWAERGHEVAFEQFVLPMPKQPIDPQNNKLDDRSLEVIVLSNKLIIHGEQFSLEFDKSQGELVSYTFDGSERLMSALRPNFWRACTDNDRGNGHPERCAVWREAGTKRALKHLEYEQDPTRVSVHVLYSLPSANHSICMMRYEIYPDGKIVVDMMLDPAQGLPEIPEIGVIFEMDGSFDNLSWYGNGPHESYWDRKCGSKLGIYKGKVKDQFVSYLRPQECGNKTDVRFASVCNSSGTGLVFEAFPSFEFNVLPYSSVELEAYDHMYKLPPSRKTVVRIMDRQMGVGGDDSWGARTHPEYTLHANRAYRYQFSMKGV